MNESPTPNELGSHSKKHWGIVHWLVVGVVLILGFALVFASFHEVQNRVYHQAICMDCRHISSMLNLYAAEHGGIYPDGPTANDALRELFKEGQGMGRASDERMFAAEKHFTPYKADNEIGAAPDFDKALQKNENHWAMTKGVNNESPGSIPLLFENPAVASWPPYWNVAEANKRVPGRALKVETVASATAGNYEVPVTGRGLSGYSIFIALKDGSVSNEELGAPNGTIATLAPDASGKNIFEYAGPHEVLDVAKGTTPVIALETQIKQTPSPSAVVETQVEQQPSKTGFQREVFQSSWDPTNKITLISDSECEMESKQGIIIASYAYEGERMRFVFTAFGSQRVSYADVYSNGIKMANAGAFRKDEVLLNAAGMRMKAEEDRVAEAEQQRINLEAPKVLIGLWKQVGGPPRNEEMDGVLFKADGTWARVNWQRKEASLQGHWQVTDGELSKGIFNVGTFFEGKIVELTQDRFVLANNGQTKIIATRVMEGVDGKKEEAGGRMSGGSTNDASANAISFLNCTLTYTSHNAEWAIYLDKEAKGKGSYLTTIFEGKGGGTYSGDVSYEITPQGGTQWKITLNWGEAKDVQEIIFWISEGDIRSGTLKAAGNVYDAKSQPMWPEGEKSMDMLFTRGKHMAAADPPTKEEAGIDPNANGGDMDLTCGIFSHRLVTVKDVSQWSFDQLRFAINFLYAKHGYVFPPREVQAVFSRKSWYRANPDISMDDIDTRMSSIEAANVKVLAEAKSRLKATAK